MLDGSPVIRGTKVPVRRLWSWHRRGTTIETLVKRYPTVGASRVLDALSFAYDHQELMQADLDREAALLGANADAIPGAMKQEKLPFG